ncbi:MAG: L-seryl-tRNA(Sec) selenium transferase [Bacilli bacterium]
MYALAESGSYRDLPAVHRLLEHEEVQQWLEQYMRFDVVASLQEALDALRDQVRSGLSPDLSEEAVTRLAKERLKARTVMHVRHVINATGTVLHTNLGRAPLAAEAIAAVADAASGYSNLEFDLKSGERGERYSHVEGLLCELTGAEAALVVNNNAAAVWLVLHELAKDRRVVISRGELVEIGGSFRISEVMAASGAHLVEVGTTNKTHERDYAKALTEGADLLMRVHASNFRIVGFTYHPPLAALVALARKFEVPFYEDLGSGSLVDLRELGIGDEPTVRASVEAGVDVVTFSGDKLLGAPQAGIICGRREFIDRLKKNQLARALRVDKLTLAGLEATLRLYRDEGQALEKIPALRMLTTPVADLRARAEQLAREITLCAGGYVRCRVIETTAQVGGGALPTEQLASSALALYPMSGSPDRLVAALREETPPIVARVAKEEVICDVRTVFPWEDEALVQGIRGAAARSAQGD